MRYLIIVVPLLVFNVAVAGENLGERILRISNSYYSVEGDSGAECLSLAYNTKEYQEKRSNEVELISVEEKATSQKEKKYIFWGESKHLTLNSLTFKFKDGSSFVQNCPVHTSPGPM